MGYVNSLKLSTKLTGGFLVVSLITLLVGFIGYQGVARTNKALVTISSERMPRSLGLQMILSAQKDIQGRERTLLIPEIQNDPEQVKWVSGRFAAAWQQAEQGLKIFAALPHTDEEEKIWTEFQTAWTTWKADHEKTLALLNRGEREAAFYLSVKEGRATFRKSVELLEKLITLNKEETTRYISQALVTGTRTKYHAVIWMVAGFVCALVLGWLMSRQVTRPINHVIAGLADASSQVASASTQISSAAQSLAEGALEQSTTVSEAVISLDEMNTKGQAAASDSERVNALMRQVGSLVKKANDSMTQLVASMREIAGSSEETSKIVKTIDEISFKTNLLALNAAVEAARAGEAGLGFAVVAGEVRNLASHAADAAKESTEMIEGTIRRIQEGALLLETVSNVFGEVTRQSSEVENFISELVASANDQAGRARHVHAAMETTDRITQQNAAAAEEAASASEQLNAQAEELDMYVGRLDRMVMGE